MTEMLTLEGKLYLADVEDLFSRRILGHECEHPDAELATAAIQTAVFDAQVVVTRRAGAEASRQVGQRARPVSRVAEEFGVCWWTIMNAVIEHGTPLG